MLAQRPERNNSRIFYWNHEWNCILLVIAILLSVTALTSVQFLWTLTHLRSLSHDRGAPLSPSCLPSPRPPPPRKHTSYASHHITLLPPSLPTRRATFPSSRNVSTSAPQFSRLASHSPHNHNLHRTFSFRPTCSTSYDFCINFARVEDCFFVAFHFFSSSFLSWT